MAALPDFQTTANLIDKYHEENAEKPRLHFGLSLVGEPCERKLWYTFRWVAPERFPGRVLRLFRRGHREEVAIIADLKSIGVVIADEQRRVSFGFGISGSIDGLIMSGVPEAPKKIHLLEMKTHNDKSFRDLKNKGVQESKPMHYAQMQAYMLGLQMQDVDVERALYAAVNKNDDEYYTERVCFDREYAERMVNRSGRIAQSEEPGIRISEDPSWYQCKFCPFSAICHSNIPVSEVNCRTCVHSTLQESGDFLCERYDAVPPEEVQRSGCRAHVVRPQLVPWALVPEKSTETTACYHVDGQDVMIGEDGYRVTEVLSGGKLNDPEADLVREVFGGEIVG